jgi:hypothetical protein
MSATRGATVDRNVSQDRKQAKSGGLSVSTLMIASLSSLAAALVVGRLWGGGTLVGAAMTPVIVALVSEGLHRPARVIDTVRTSRTGRFDPVAEGRAGLRDGDLDDARPAPIPAAAAAQVRVHRASTEPRRFSLRLPRPRVMAAVATGLVAFAIAGIFLTSSELVLGKSVTSSSRRTTFVPVKRSTAKTETQKDKTETTTSTTSTTTTPTTTTTPPAESTPAPTETTPTVPPAQGTTPAVPPATTTAPAAPPATTPQATPAPTPTTP